MTDHQLIDPATAEAALISGPHPDLRAALMEMLAYQSVMGSRTAFYHYAMDLRDWHLAHRRGLLAAKERGGQDKRPMVRLTKFGCEVAKRLTEETDAPTG